MNMKKYPVSSPPHSPRRGEAWQTPRFLQRQRSRNCVQPISPAGGGWGVDIPPSGGLGGLLDAFLRNAFVVEHSFSTERYIPTECSLMTTTGHPVETRLIASLQSPFGGGWGEDTSLTHSTPQPPPAGEMEPHHKNQLNTLKS